MVFTFVFYGEPVAQARPKFTRIGGFVRAIDPAKSRNYKQDLKMYVQNQMHIQGIRMLNGALKLYLDVYRPIPKGWSNKKHIQAENGYLRPTTKPDCSNYLKGVEDALNGILYADDSQIVSVIVNKWYSEQPRVLVKVEESEE